MNQKTKFDSCYLLPGIPDEHDACSLRLRELIQSKPGIEKAHWENGNGETPGQFCVHFDPDRISLGKVRALVKSTGAELDHRYGHLQLRTPVKNARRARSLREKIVAVPGVVDVGVSIDGVVRIEFDRTIAEQQQVLAELGRRRLIGPQRCQFDELDADQLKTDHGRVSSNQHSAEHSHDRWLFLGERTELWFAIACGVFLVAGWLLSRFTTISPQFLIPIYWISYLFGGFFALLESLDKLRHRQFEIDFLMIVAAVGAGILGNWAEGALLLFLFSISHSLEHYAMGHARQAIEALSELAPDVATAKRNGRVVEVPVDELVVGDTVIVKPNERLPADGFVTTGETTIDQSPITGESLPVEKRPVDDGHAGLREEQFLSSENRVFAGTINQSGAIEIQVTRLSTESTLARVVTMVNEAETHQSTTQRFAEKFERVFVPSVLIGVGFLLLAWLVIDETFGQSFYRAMAVLVAASPCALAISTPSAVLSGVARAARGGVLFKGGAPLEELGRVNAIAFDKTGTLTEGKPRLVDIVPSEGVQPFELLAAAVAVESLSDHPLAAAISRDGRDALDSQSVESDTPFTPAENLQSITGRGVSAQYQGETAYLGKRDLFNEVDGPGLPGSMIDIVESLEKQGRTTMIVRLGSRYLGVLGLMDTPRATAKESVEKLRQLGIDRMIMLSGDNQYVASAVAAEVGIDEAWGDLMPAEKVDSIRQLRNESTVAMIGDGVNDAPAMAYANVGVAMGAAGSDVALETADVALMSDELRNLPFAIGLSRMTNLIIKQNIWISLGMVACLVPATILGLRMGPAVALHEGSTVVVVLNALRLLAVRKPD